METKEIQINKSFPYEVEKYNYRKWQLQLQSEKQTNGNYYFKVIESTNYW